MTYRFASKACYLFILGILAIPLLCENATAEAVSTPTLKVAFLGDQGIGDNAQAVLQLVADEGTDLLLIQGDLGYTRGASTEWIANIDRIMGENFPVLVTVGNHENFEWPIYQNWLIQRINDVPELTCQGNPGVKAHCSYRGMSIVQVAQGVSEVGGVASRDNYAEYIEDELSNSANIWRVCSWHKNQRSMQVGGKSDATGWGVYSACLRNGGIVTTGHAHSYSRTHLMQDFENRTVVHRNGLLEIGPGTSFAFVSGLGGQAIREQKLSGDWWASIYSSTQNASHGALFCTLTGDLANCEFKDVLGAVPDKFTLSNRNRPGGRTVRNEIIVTLAPESRGKISLLLFVVILVVIWSRWFAIRQMSSN